MGFCSDGPVNVYIGQIWPNLNSVALAVPEIRSIAVLGGGCEPNLGEEEAGGAEAVGDGTVRKSVGEFL